MTYLVPRLYLLRRDDGSAASRFSSMVTLMIKRSKFHASVVTESLVFFECLSAHQKLLSAKCLSVAGTDNPSMSMFPIAFSILEAQRIYTLKTIPNSMITGCEGSIFCLRAAIVSIRGLIRIPDGPMFDHLMNSGINSHLFALLERTLSSRQYFCSQSFRAVASPLNSETLMQDSELLSAEIRGALESILCSDIDRSSNVANRLLHWLLLSKTIINGDVGIAGSGDDESGNSAHEKALEMFQLAGSCRWQLRYEMAQLACVAIDSYEKLQSGSNSDGGKDGHTSTALPSIIVPHVGALVGTACAISVATSDQSELFAYQKIGLKMLYSLIHNFSGFADPTDADSKLLDEYVSQIIPSVKHALSYDIDEAEDSIDTEGARELFLSGCECLQLLAKDGLIPDLHALNRLMKTVLPSEDMLAFSAYPIDGGDDLSALQRKPTSFVDNRTSILLPRVASIWTIADIYMSGEMGLLQDTHFDTVKNELNSIADVLAINSAALAIDSCRIKEMNSKNGGVDGGSEASPFELKSGLTFCNVEDVDTATKQAMEGSCATMACFGLILILKSLRNETEGSARFEDLMSWTGRLMDVILTEFYACMEDFESCTGDDTLPSSLSETCASCLLVLGKIVEESAQFLSSEEIRHVLYCIFKTMKFPDITTQNEEDALSLTDENTKTDDVHVSTFLPSIVMSQACAFVETVCRSDKKEDVGMEFLLSGVLAPLITLEDVDDEAFFKESSNAAILNSLIRSAQTLLDYGDENEQVVKALLNYALKMLGLVDESSDSELKDSFHELIRFCMSSDVVPDEERLLYIEKMAQGGNWDAWRLCINDNPTAVSGSLGYIQEALSDHSNESRHISALSAIVNVTKSHTDLIPSVIGSVGPRVLELFQLYGVHQLHGNGRTMACATCMKIVMFTFQYLSSQGADTSNEAAFLSVVFEVLVGIISYNGLPNEAKANPGSDPALGRMSAQFFVHVLRTSPSVFKECMGTLNDNVRSVLETSVRADMSGYTSRTAPAKKKLNLQSFKK